MDDVLKNAIHTFGRKTQALVAVEEMAELQKEVLKNINRNEPNEIKIAEEIADVEIMLEQLKLIYGCEKNVENIKGYKLEKLRCKLEEEG